MSRFMPWTGSVGTYHVHALSHCVFVTSRDLSINTGFNFSDIHFCFNSDFLLPVFSFKVSRLWLLLTAQRRRWRWNIGRLVSCWCALGFWLKEGLVWLLWSASCRTGMFFNFLMMPPLLFDRVDYAIILRRENTKITYWTWSAREPDSEVINNVVNYFTNLTTSPLRP